MKKKIDYRIIIGAVFILAFLLILVNQFRNKLVKKIPYYKVVPTPVVLHQGVMEFRPSIKTQTVKKNNNLYIDIVATSAEKNIVGYDLIIKYDASKASIVGAKSLLGDFSLYPLVKSNPLILTGIKNLTSTKPTVLSNTPIIRINVTPKTDGPLSFTVLDKYGAQKSEMIDDRTRILLPSVGGVEFNVE